MKTLFVTSILAIFLISGLYILYNRYDNGYIQQQNMWYDSEYCFFTFVYYHDSLYHSQKDPDGISEAMKELRYKEAEEKLRLIKSK